MGSKCAGRVVGLMLVLLVVALVGVSGADTLNLERIDALDTELVDRWEAERAERQAAGDAVGQQAALTARRAAENARTAFVLYRMLPSVEETEGATPQPAEPGSGGLSGQPVEPSEGAVLVLPGDSLASVFSGAEAGATILLPLGAVFDEMLPVPRDGTTVGVYGSGDRPVVQGFDLANQTRRGLRFEGIEFRGDKLFRGVGVLEDTALVDCRFRGATRGPVFQGTADRPHRNIRVERCIIGGQVNDVSPEPRGIGIYARFVEGLVVHANVFHNVAYEHPRRKYSQAAYLSDGTAGAILSGNVFLRIGASAFQLRAGGEVADNIIIRQAPHSWVGGAASKVLGNLVVLAEDLTGEDYNPRGGGLCIEKGGEGSLLAGNMVFSKRGTNANYGGYKFEVAAETVTCVGNVTDYPRLADAWGKPVEVPGISRVATPDLAGLEAWAEGLIGRGYGEAMPSVSGQISSVRGRIESR